jgi:hypothetical protein
LENCISVFFPVPHLALRFLSYWLYHILSCWILGMRVERRDYGDREIGPGHAARLCIAVNWQRGIGALQEAWTFDTDHAINGNVSCVDREGMEGGVEGGTWLLAAVWELHRDSCIAYLASDVQVVCASCCY